MPELPHQLQCFCAGRVGDEEHIVVNFRPVVPLKYIKVNLKLNKPFPIEEIKLKTRFQILKECS